VAVEYLPGLGQQIGLRERLLHQRHVRVEPALRGQDRTRVAGHEQHLDARLDRPHPLRHLPAQHVRHDNVGDKKMDLAWMGAGYLKSLRPIGGRDHTVAVAAEDPLSHLAQGCLVLHDQDDLPFG